jgi:hypothetical protein
MKIDSVNVIWVGGKRQSLLNQNSNQKITIQEINSPRFYANAYFLPFLLAVIALAILIFLAVRNFKFPFTTSRADRSEQLR